MSNDEQPKQPDYQPPRGASTTGTWNDLTYTASGGWTVLRKQDKPSAEIFAVAYVAEGNDLARPVTFVFNGGPGASSAFLHVGVVGPQRVAFPPDGSLPPMPPRLEHNDDSWLAFTDLVFVDPVGTGFSRIVEPDKNKKDKDAKPEEHDPKEYFGYKRDLESMTEFMGRWLSANDRWGSPVFIAGESYGGYRVGRLVRQLQEMGGIGLNGAILISPALEIGGLNPDDYAIAPWVDLVPTMAAAAAHHGRSRVFERGTPKQRAWMFIPDDPRLRVLAARIAEQRRHSLKRALEQALEASPFAAPAARFAEQMSLFAALSAVATDAVEPDDDFAYLEEADDELSFELALAPPPPLADGGTGAGVTLEERRWLRDQNAALARDLAKRTKLSHAKVNAELNKQAGVEKVTTATAAQLQKRLLAAERWLTKVA